MKRFLNILLLFVVALSFTSCEADMTADIANPGEEFVIDYGTVLITDGQGWSNNYIIRDDGIALLVFGEQGYLYGTTNGSRVLINYNVLGDLSPLHLPESCKAGYAIQLNVLLALPCQQVIIGTEPQQECSPVVVRSMHIGKSHLDLHLDYKSLNNQKHKFDLYCPNPDAEELDLYLVHYGDNDKNNDGQMISSHRISFDIAPLRSNQPRKIRLHWVDITGTKRVHTGDYNVWP
jgi:hypothetical protein